MDASPVQRTLLRQTRRYIEFAHDWYSINSRKVEQMAIAHRALKNFIGAMLLLVFGLVGIRLLLVSSNATV